MSTTWAAERIGHEKSLPAAAVGLTAAEFVASGVRLSDLDTPLVVLDRTALQHNIDLMAGWAAAAGVSLQPHGKTTMAPALWHRQLTAGAIGLTLATVSQARIAHWAGIGRIQIANELTSPQQVREVARLNTEGTEVVVWVDSVAAVDLVSAAVESSGAAPVPVLVELGVPGGRAGARTVADGLAVAERAAAAPGVALRGTAGYEGAVAHSRQGTDLAAVDAYLADLVELHRRAGALLPGGGPGVLTAGGSAYFDHVVAQLAGPIADGAEVIVRAGASILHDHGVYEQLSPLSSTNQPLSATNQHAGNVFVPAARGFGRVHSVPEPGLAIVEGGKRDFAYDEHLPVLLRRRTSHGWLEVPAGSGVVATNDQHNFLRTDQPLAVGDLVEYGLSHPCTIMDKWRWLPLVDGFGDEDPVVVDLVRTWF